MSTSALPLAGIRVVELGALVAAPYCAMLLADLGAEVVKVEPPEGDMARQFAPFVNDESAFFMSVNRGKRSVRLDVKDPTALAAVKELVSRADVVIHNYRTGVAERLGLGYDDLSADNAGLVYCAVSGFGPTGPMAKRPGIDLIFQAESGMLSVTGTPDGPPVKVGTNAADVYAATTAALCIVAALGQRHSTGRGCRVDVALRDAFLALQACWSAVHLATGAQPTPMGSASPFTAPTEVFATSDSSIVVAVVNGRHWQIFCEVTGLEQVAQDPRFASNELRVANLAELRPIVAQALAGQTTAHWLRAFDAGKIPAGRVMGYEEVYADEQIQHNGMLLEMEHSQAGTIRLQGIPFWFDGEKAQPTVPPPALGEHTREILAGLGYDASTVERLASS